MFGLGKYVIGWWGNGGGSGGGGVQSVVAGTQISVDNTDPENPIVSSTGAPALIEVANYSALPDPTTVQGQSYIVLASQGTWWLPGSLGGTYYGRGYYYSDGTATWVFSDVPYNASQATVNTGTNDDSFVTPLTLANSTQWATKISQSLATAANDFLVASGVGVFVKKTLAETKTILGLVFGSTAGTYAEGDDARLIAVQSSTDKYAVATGTNTYVASLTPAPTAYVTGNTYWIKIPNVNTTTTPTLNINSLGAKTIKSENGVAIPINFFIANGNYSFLYDGTDFIVQAGLTDRKDIGYYRKYGTTNYERWYVQSLVGTATLTARALDVLTASPFIASKTLTLDRIGLEVGTIGSIGAVARLGIYADNGNMYPGALVLDAGTVPVDAVAVSTITISQVLPPGLYWLVYVHNSAVSPVFRTISAANMGNPLGISAVFGTAPGTAVNVAFTYAALPNPFPAGAGVQTSSTVLIGVRLSA